MRAGFVAVAGVLASVLVVSCRCDSEKKQAAPVASSKLSAPRTSASAGASAAALVPLPPPHTRIGSALALSPDERRLLVVDEDHHALRVATLPLAEASLTSVDLPGAPAQVVVAGARVLVTIRQPSLLWIADMSGEQLVEVARVALPDDAWGVAITGDSERALVTSAWSSQASLVDLKAAKVSWSLPLRREPRGVVISRNDRAYVTHLVGAKVTELDLGAPSPTAVEIVLPASPLRAAGETLNASLGYALAFDKGEDRLFAARHALGARGKNAWFGASSVDVWLTATREPLAPRGAEKPSGARSQLAEELISGGDTDFVGGSLTPFTQPRAMVFRASTSSLLVAGEGDDRIAELDGFAVDPTLAVMRLYQVGKDYHPTIPVAAEGGAPTGLALTRDEQTLYVYCRSTNDVVRLPLAKSARLADAAPEPRARLALAPDPLGPGGATGRKLFYNSTDHATSGGLGCAGCHPDGRDDGHVWHEASFTTEDGDATIFVGSQRNIPPEAHTNGFARRTPMLAGRVNAEGPYGWHAESPTIVDREVRGFGLHRWGAVPERAPAEVEMRAKALGDFLRRGLVPPPASKTLDEQARRGEALFSSKPVGCAECHVPATGYTTRQAYPLPALPLRAGFDDEPDTKYKIPSLAFLVGRAPYFHDGSAASLEQLVERNGNRMGKTAQLSAAERADLVAFLKTL
jgi:DNA-binding beta-propeller fold protein YncE/mono/diheme cytochrome c family protein